MIFYFTNMDVFIAPEKTDKYRIIFKFHVLKLVISFLTLLHCLASIRCGLGTREGSGHGRERPAPALWATAWSLPPVWAGLRDGSSSPTAWEPIIFPSTAEWGVMDSETFCEEKVLDHHLMTETNSWSNILFLISLLNFWHLSLLRKEVLTSHSEEKG